MTSQLFCSKCTIPNYHWRYFPQPGCSVNALFDELDLISTNDIQRIYSLLVVSTKWVECQLHLDGVSAIQNNTDNLKL